MHNHGLFSGLYGFFWFQLRKKTSFWSDLFFLETKRQQIRLLKKYGRLIVEYWRWLEGWLRWEKFVGWISFTERRRKNHLYLLVYHMTSAGVWFEAQVWVSSASFVLSTDVFCDLVPQFLNHLGTRCFYFFNSSSKAIAVVALATLEVSALQAAVVLPVRWKLLQKGQQILRWNLGKGTIDHPNKAKHKVFSQERFLGSWLIDFTTDRQNPGWSHDWYE